MTDEVTSGEIRVRQFDVVRKGYDRNQVELFLAQVARQFDALETQLADAANDAIAVGIDDPEALVREFSTIGSEIGVILESARSAAEGIRTRAATDADSWTSEARTHVEESTSDAETQSRAARGSAWEEGSSLLAAATEKAAKMVADAETDALRIRAEAEREAIRYTNDAKRASEEAIGAAENEAEGILSTSRAESERVLRVASQSAELAQERARALEDRRSELLVELESTRSSIGELETEFESKRQALEEPEPAPAPAYDERSHHDTGGGTVKIISGSQVVPLRPVDADSFVAEVAEMHRSAITEEIPQPPPVSHQPVEHVEVSAGPEVVVGTSEDVGSHVQVLDTGHQTPDAEEQAPVPPPPPVSAAGVEERGSVSSQLPADRAQPAVAESAQPPAATHQQEREQHDDEPEPTLEEDPVVVEPSVDVIGSLFAQLRDDGQQQANERRQPSSRSGKPDTEASEVPEAEATAYEIPDVTHGESLIPVQNAALRTIKRQLVDLQNDALEHLRTDESWVPTEEFTDRFSEPFSDLAAAITVDGDDGGAASVFATDLYDAVSNAVVGSREGGSGDRAIAAATSRVFRTWRSDEAERRVVAIASDLSEDT
jgi:DivIVA domain-containing protein